MSAVWPGTSASKNWSEATYKPAGMIHDVIPDLLKRSIPIAIYETPEYIKDTGSPNRHADAEEDLRQDRVHAVHLSVR
ncbi:hypothetical protein ACC689_36195, partial [Rhizobium ruizarguesonis]